MTISQNGAHMSGPSIGSFGKAATLYNCNTHTIAMVSHYNKL